MRFRLPFYRQKQTLKPVRQAQKPVVGPISPRIFRQRSGRIRAYDGAKINALVADWCVPTATSGDEEVYKALARVRERARDQAQNNPWVKSWIRVMKRNVVGSRGIQFKSQAYLPGSFTEDKNARDAIQLAWKDFSRCVTVDKRHDLGSFLEHTLIGHLVAGEIYIQKKPNFRGNRYRFGLKLIEAEWLDHEYNEVLRNGNEVRMGVEINTDGAPVAYHFFERHPGEVLWPRQGVNRKRIRVPASEIIHFYDPERPSDVRGMSQLSSALWSLKMLGEYEKAELVAARKAANEGVFFEKEAPEEWNGEGLPVGLNADGQPVDVTGEVVDGDIEMISEPGEGVELPIGVKPHFYNPTHPSAQFAPFTIQQVRKFAASVGVSYHTLAADLERVNYSSAQVGGIEEKETFRQEQNRLINRILAVIFPEWLDSALMARAIPGLDPADYDRCLWCEWKPRVWPSADPRKDLEAKQIAKNNGWQSDQEIIAELTGRDSYDVIEDRRIWKEENEAAGLPTGPVDASGGGQNDEAAETPPEDGA